MTGFVFLPLPRLGFTVLTRKLEHHYHPTEEEKANGKSALSRIHGVIKEVLKGKSLIPPPAETAAEQILKHRAKVEALAKREREQGLSKPKC